MDKAMVAKASRPYEAGWRPSSRLRAAFLS